MNIRKRRLPVLLAALAAVTVAACGDDSVNPSNPEAGSAKDATPEAADGGHDGAVDDGASGGDTSDGGETEPD